jgi:hypothetical protein
MAATAKANAPAVTQLLVSSNLYITADLHLFEQIVQSQRWGEAR